jgi:hypothetical protein
MAHTLPFRPDSYVSGLRLVPLTQKDKSIISRAVSDAKKWIPAKSLDSFFAAVELAIAAYRAEANMAKHLTKAAATEKLVTLRDQTKHLLDALISLDDSTQWLIRDHDQPDDNTLRTKRRATRTYKLDNDSQQVLPITSLDRMLHDLCGFYNVLSDAVARVKTWPKGRREDYARRHLAYFVAKALRQSSVEPTLARNGAYARTLCAIMGVIGGELKGKSKAKKPDVMELMRHGLRILKSESPQGEVTII